MIESINAITLATHDMPRAVQFYTMLGFELKYGGEAANFTSFHAGTGYLNLTAQPGQRRAGRWSRIIFHVSDVDTLYTLAIKHGIRPETAPRDADWGERFFHVIDPDGHELSFARPL